MENRRAFISAGEASGDIAGALLVAELRHRDPNIAVFGTGGPRMQRAGAFLISDTSDIGVVGVTEVARTLPAVAAAYRRIRRCVRETRPDVAVLIGNDAFNVVLARWLRRQRIPTVAYFPPQVWLWRSLAGVIARSFDAIVTSFPDEQRIYAAARSEAEVRFVGHYLANCLRPATAEERAVSRRRLGLADAGLVVGLLPGSRRGEIASLAPVMLDAAKRLAARDATLSFVVASTEATARPLAQLLAAHGMTDRMVMGSDSHGVMRAIDVAMVASGTASLEAALIGAPMVIVYKVSGVTNLIARGCIALGLLAKYEIGLPNLVLGSGTVPEVLQERATGPLVAETVSAFLASPERRDETRAALAQIGWHLQGARPIAEVADVAMDWAQRTPLVANGAAGWLRPTRLKTVARE